MSPPVGKKLNLKMIITTWNPWALLMIFILAVTVSRQALAIPANPHPIILKQPDGTEITLYIRGDEWFNWFEDLNGYTVVIDKGWYVYADLDPNSKLAPTDLVVGQADPRIAGLTERLIPPPSIRKEIRATTMNAESQYLGGPLTPPFGTVKNLVVLCKFKDHLWGSHTRPETDYEILFNAVGGDPILAPTGSIRDFYLENSYGLMVLNSTVAAWVELPETEAYYAYGSCGFGGPFPHNAQGMVRDALDKVDDLIDFGEFDEDNNGHIDAITIIHSGYGAETGGGVGNWIWSHRWWLYQLPGGKWISSDVNDYGQNVKVYDYDTEPALWGSGGNAICRIGVVAHETGHFFGLPDLYDTDYSGEGIGSWGIMANAWGFDGSQKNPPHFSAWSKIFLGWVNPTIVKTSGSYAAPQVETNPVVFRIDSEYPTDEYLLLENRQPVGVESIIPQGGLAIWHIDETKGSISNNDVNDDEGYPGQSGWPSNNRHYRVALLQADGNYDLEKGINRGDQGDLYHADGVSAIGPDTVPNTNAYQNGNIIVTNNYIFSISQSGPIMTFEVDTPEQPEPCELVYNKDFESGLGDMVIDNNAGDGNGLWHLTTTCQSPYPRHSRITALYYGIDGRCNYDRGRSEGVVTTPTISLADVHTPIQLTFKYFLETEDFANSYDLASVEVSENGGPFYPIAHNDPDLGVTHLADLTEMWAPAAVDLSAMADSDIQIRFRFRTVDAFYNNFKGFFIDDIQISGDAPAVSPMLVGAQSAKTHGDVELYIDLPLDPPEAAGVECCAGGPEKVILTFNKPIKACDNSIDDEVALSVGDLDSVSIDNNKMIIHVSNVPNRSCLAITLTGICDFCDRPLVGENDLHIRTLLGDTSGNGMVSGYDLGLVKEYAYQEVDNHNCQTDINLDGAIDNDDLLIVMNALWSLAACP